MKNKFRIAILVSKFNPEVTGGLLRCATKELIVNGVSLKNIFVEWVPGAYELPYAAHVLAASKKYDAVLCFGCVIKGETSHDLFVSLWATLGVGWVSLQSKTPVLFGVLTPKNEAQALTRSRPGPLNRGKEVAAAALDMIRFRKKHGR